MFVDLLNQELEQGEVPVTGSTLRKLDNHKKLEGKIMQIVII